MPNIVVENRVLKTVCSIVPYIKLLYNNEVCVGVTDNERFILAELGNNFRLPFKAGTPITPGMAESQSKNKPIVMEIPIDIMEESNVNTAKSYFFPITDNGKVVGCLVVAVLLDRRYELDQIVETLEQQVTSLSEVVSNVTTGVATLLSMNEELLHKTKEATIKANDTDEIVNMIQGISSKTNLLGLNASIEAARSGEAGKGFGVVAKEIQKLSITSKDSITKIDEIIKDISVNIQGIDTGLDNINGVSQQQAESIKALTSTMDEVKKIIERLHDLATKL